MRKTKTQGLVILAIGIAGGYWLMTKYLAKPATQYDPTTGLPAPPASTLDIPQLSGYIPTRRR